MTIGMGGAKVKGLDELRRELRKLDDKSLIDELKDTNFEVANSLIGPMQSKAASVGAMEAKAASTLTASRQAARAQLNFGGAKAPFAGGAEFGAGQDLRRNPVSRRSFTNGVLGWNQFNAWRGNDNGAGYFMYPTIRDRIPDLVDTYGDALERITARAFPD